MLSLDYIFYYKRGEYYDRNELNARFEPEIAKAISRLLEKIFATGKEKSYTAKRKNA
ncbi:MAG TPA: hypothetical protein PKW24_03010 [Clostridiales bacterium]|jgi:hypothetical protein|nr:hypothetical protein [Clostridiales bacterium]HRT81829.1 hypothetical protein [Oscillospiraceae bacterium]